MRPCVLGLGWASGRSSVLPPCVVCLRVGARGSDVHKAVLARAASWRVRPKRSAEATQRRRAKAKQRKRGRTNDDRSSGGGDDGNSVSSHGPEAEAPHLQAALAELRATRLALKDRTEVLALTRKQLRRETKTSKTRWQQLARRDSKAAKKLSRKLFAKQARAVAGAARREHTRVRKRKQPEGEILHSSERKHQRLVGKGAGGHGKGKGGRGGKGGGAGSGRGGGGRRGERANGGSSGYRTPTSRATTSRT